MTLPEFSRPERLDAIGAGEREISIVADADERAALARRFGLVSVERLEGMFRVHREATGIVARGRVCAAVVQTCVATDAPLPASIDEAVALRFVAEASQEPEEIELDADALDTVPYDGNAIDLGEAAAETMALALDSFPRARDAAAVLRAAGVIAEEEALPLNPFAGLKAALEKRQS